MNERTLHDQRAPWAWLVLVAAMVLALGPAGCPDECGDDDASDDDAGDDDADPLACADVTDPVPIEDTKLYFERNDTDGDTGLHGLLDQSGWAELCVYRPDGEQILALKPVGQLQDLGLSELFFESREPEDAEVPIEDHLAHFPEGQYEVRGRTWDGIELQGFGTVTHDVPAGPVVTSPTEGAAIPTTGLVVSWEPVTDSLLGGTVEITGYEVIVVDEEDSDPHGNSVPEISIHVRPTVTSVAIPDGFLEPGTIYGVEVIAIEVSGNQTITELVVETEEA